MNNVIRLAQMGCGSAILNSCIDRGNISAVVANANKFLKYYKYALNTGLYTKEQCIDGLLPYYNKLKDVEHLVNIYSGLWANKYSKIILQIEKFIS